MTERKTKRATSTNRTTTGAGIRSASLPRRGTFTLERVLDAPVERVWDLWTTKKGLESWWGPQGFSTKFKRLEVRPGGRLQYVMTATGPEQVQMVESLGLPRATTSRGTFVLVEPRSRLEFTQVVDFVPGVPAFDVGARVEFHPVPNGGVRLVVEIEKMHDDNWTKNARMGWSSQLDRLADLLG